MEEYRLEAEMFRGNLMIWLRKGFIVIASETVCLWPRRSLRKRMDKAANALAQIAKDKGEVSSIIEEFNRDWKGAI